VLTGFMVAMPVVILDRSALVTQIKLFLGMAVGLGLLWVWLARGLPDRPLILHRNPVLLPIGAYALGSLISALVVSYRWASIPEWGRQMTGFLLFWAAAEFFRSKTQVSRFAAVAVGTATLLALHAIGQWTGLIAFNWSRSIRTGLFATFGHPNFFAAYLVLMLSLAVAWAVHEWPRSRGKAVALSLAAALISIALVLTQSLGAFLGVSVGALFLFVVWRERRRRLRLLLAGAIVAAVLLGIVLSPFGRSFFRANNFRVHSYRAAARAALDNPLGTGIGTFAIHFPEYRGSRFLRTLPIAENLLHAHSEYLEAVSADGIILFALWLWILLAGAETIRRLLQRCRPGHGRELVTILSAGLVAFLAHNAVSVNMRWDAPAMTFWFMSGLTIAVGRIYAHSKPQQDRPRERDLPIVRWDPPAPLRWGLLGLCSLAIVVAGVYAFRVTRSNIYYQQIEVQLLNYRRPPPGVDITRPNPLLEAAFDKAISSWPWNMPALYDRAYYYSVSQQFGKAAETYETIRRYHPHYQRIGRNLGIVYIALGRFRDAERVLRESLAYNDCEKNRYLLAQAVESQGDAQRTALAYTEFLELSLDFLRGIREREKKAPPGFQQVRPENYEEVRSDTVQAFRALRRALVSAADPQLLPTVLDRLTAADPEHPWTRILEAWVLQDQGRWEEALQRYEPILAERPDLVQAWSNAGECYFKLGRLEEARRAFQSSLELEPNQPLIRGRLATVEELLQQSP